MIDAKTFYDTNKKDTKKLPAGIHANLTVTFEEGTWQDLPFIDVNFTNDQGYANYRFWEPKPGSERYEERKKSMLNDYMDLLMLFVTKEEVLELKGETVIDFLRNGYNLVKDFLVPVNIKLLPDRDGVYTRWPKFPPMFEKYSEKFPISLKFTRYELENYINKKPDLPKTDEPMLF